jgi:LCP family protein required for cell wall assembly
VSEPPGDDPGESGGSAPWERPQRWKQQRMDVGKVDDLLARLGSEDEMSGRRRRRRAQPGRGAQVPASQLIADIGAPDPDGPGEDQDRTIAVDPSAAPLSAGQPSGGQPSAVQPSGGAESTVAFRPTVDSAQPAGAVATSGPVATSRSDGPAAPPATPATPATPARPGDLAGPESTVAFRPTGDPDEGSDRTVSVRRDFGGPGTVSVPGSDDSTDEMVQFGQQEDVLAIRESLRRQYPGSAQVGLAAVGTVAVGAAGSGDGTGAARAVPARVRDRSGGRSRRATRGFLWAGRGLIAVVSAAVLAYAGTEWNLIRATDAGLQQKSGSYLQTTDPNISTPTTARPSSGSANATPPAAPSAAAPAAPAVTPRYPAENILLLGSDTRANGNGDASNSDGTQDTAQSDTLMIAHVSADRQNVTILSVPRDLRIPAPHCRTWDYRTRKQSAEQEPVSATEHWKITNAYSVGGPACSVLAVQHLTGLRIDRVIEIDFKGFKTMVDALGGINLNVCRPIKDQELGLIVAQGGVQKIQGDQALSLVRARKVQNDGIGNDFGRIRRQQVVLSTMLRQLTSAGTLLNPGKLDRFLHAFVDATYTDNVTMDSLISLAHQLGNLAPGRVTFYTLPTHPNTKDGGDTQIMDAKGQAIFAALINDQRLPGEEVAAAKTGSAGPTPSAPKKSTSTSAGPSTSTPPSTSIPPSTSTPPSSTTAATTSAAPQTLSADPGNIDLQIVNLTGKPGVAGQVMDALNGYGFTVTGNDLLRPVDRTQPDITVEYAAGHRDAAVMVAAAVPGSRLVQNEELGARIRLSLGTSFDGTVTRVSVGQAVPTGLQSTPSKAPVSGSTPATVSGTPTKSAPATSASPFAAHSSASSSAKPTPTVTLKSTDLQSVNAGDATCA